MLSGRQGGISPGWFGGCPGCKTTAVIGPPISPGLAISALLSLRSPRREREGGENPTGAGISPWARLLSRERLAGNGCHESVTG
jgi:hypothetical protein